MKEGKLRYLIMLFACALLWGSTYPCTKYAVGFLKPVQLITLRFAISAIILTIIYRKEILAQQKSTYIKGIKAGLFLFFVYFFNQSGAQYTEASKQAFISGTYVVIVPFVLLLFEKKKPLFKEFISAVICMLGLTIISGVRDFTNINKGDLLTLTSTFFYAYYVYIVSVYSKEEDPVIMSIIQMAVVAIISGFIWSIKPQPLPNNFSLYAVILYLSIGCTLFAITMQNIAQKHISASITSVILSLEIVFGGILGVIILDEPITINLILGAILCFSGIIIGNIHSKKENAI